MEWLVGIVMVQGHFSLEWKYFGVSEQFCEALVFVGLNLDCPHYFSKNFLLPPFLIRLSVSCVFVIFWRWVC